MKRSFGLAVAGLIPLALVTCKAGSVGEIIEPDKPTAADAVGELECSDDQSTAEPLIVDWGSDDRTDLEVAMRDGIVVASYDCNSFRVLDNCRVSGGYKFAGVSRKEDVIQILGADELHANFPLGAAKFEAGLDRSSAIDVALVTIGKHRALTSSVARVELEGDCESATHFVRSALVGAFAVGTGTRGHAGTVAEVFKLGDIGGSSTSEQQSINRDGDLASCGSANPLDEAPPPQCQSLLRVELVALSEAPVAREAATPESTLANVCSVEGFVWDGSKCTKASEAKDHRCSPSDAAECRAQCDAGNADSCFNLASMTAAGRAGLTADPAAATALYAQACEGDSFRACSFLAFRLDWKAEPERVTALFQKACDGGSAMDCRSLGNELIRGDRLGKDEVRGEKLLISACAMAENFACSDLAVFYYDVRRDAARGLAVMRKDCEAGNGMTCSIMGGWLSRCEDGRAPGMSVAAQKGCEKFPDTNASQATLAFEAACRSKFFGACRVAGDRIGAGQGVPADAAKAHELYAFGCPNGLGACEGLGRSFERGEGVAADLSEAYDAYAKACDTAGKAECYEAARVAKQLGNDTDYRARLEKGCKKSSRRACDELTKLLEQAKQTDEAKAIYEDICTRMRDKAYCASFVRLGGELPPDFKPFKPRAGRQPDDF